MEFSHSINVNLRRSLVHALACLALAMGSLAISNHASASAASGPGVSAVNAKLASISSGLKAEYFKNKENSVPQWTPSGGVFQYFNGSSGEGAIYWSSGTGAHVIYGAILVFWRQSGYEVVDGYPTSDELAGNPASFCGAGVVREQHFNAADYLCWDGSEVYLATTVR